MKFGLTYLALVVLSNLGFSYLPLIPIGGGEMFSVMSFAVGAVFVLRDFAQREAGHYVLLYMVAAAVVSYILADPFVAVASLIAFVISEAVDWAVYSVSKRSFRERVLLSSVISTPVDSAVFMLVAGFFSWYGLAAMVASKLIAAGVVYRLAQSNEV